MIICLANSKGGQGKSTAAIHLAAFFQKQAATLLVDSDHVRASLAWGREGKLPFDVVDESDQEAAMRRRRYDHVVLDTPGSIDPRGLKELAAGCNLMVLPAIGVLGLERYRAPADPFLIMLAAVAIVAIAQRVILSRPPTAGADDDGANSARAGK